MIRPSTVRFAALAVIFLIGGSACAAEQLPLKPGEYILTITYEVQEQRENQAHVVTRCITRVELDDPERIFTDENAAKQSSCPVRNLQTSAGRISYDADCHSRSVHVEGTLGAAEFAVVRTVRPKGNQNVTLKLTIRANRSRDCANSSDARF